MHSRLTPSRREKRKIGSETVVKETKMKHCEFHPEGDLTAHATVEWFVFQLLLPDDAEGFFDNFREGESPLSDDFCKDLNTVHFIDCLREQVRKDKSLFKRIEDIAKAIEEKNGWEKFPNLCILLLSIARQTLLPKKHPEESNLYRTVEQVYYHCRKQPEPCDCLALALKAGFQLSHFPQDDRWYSEFASLILSYKELSDFRMEYYSTNDMATYSNQVVERWKRRNKKNGDTVQKFNDLDDNFYDLNPLCLGLPIRDPSATPLKFAEDFAQDFRDLENAQLEDKKEESKKKSTELAKKYRIFQWEILVQNLVEEFRDKELRFKPITSIHAISGRPSSEFLNKFISEAQSVEGSFIHAHKEMPEKRPNNPSIEVSFLDSVKEKLKNSQRSFTTALLPKAFGFYSSIHEDIVRSFANRGTKELGKSESSMLIEDGELSFFSMLWLLRYAVGVDEQQLKSWEFVPEDKRKFPFNPEVERTVCFRFGDNVPESQWSQFNMYEFAKECGFIIPLSEDGMCILTRRWQSLIAWLRWLNHNLGNSPEDDKKYLQNEELVHDNPLVRQLPVKSLDYGKEESAFVRNLWMFFRSERLTLTLNEADRLFHKVSLGFSIPREEFAKGFGRLVESFSNYALLEGGSSIGLEDRVLLGCSRGFVPVEHLFRAYQPYELHLLIQALNWEDSSLENWERTPVSLGFATIAGRVETDQDSRADFDRWLVPYRSLFSDLSANFILPTVQNGSEQIGARTQQQHFAHQTSGLLNTVWLDPKRVDLSFESRAAIWMARIHVQEVWGGFPIDTKKLIYQEDFPDWERLGNRKIFDRLVDLGVQGGIMRASKPDVGSKLQEYAWDLGGELKNANPEEVKRIISCVLSSLLFELPEDTPPPAWVNTKAFAICFFHGMRQAVYHALKNKQENKRCLWIDWDSDRVSIFNRGFVTEEQRHKGVDSKDHTFFAHFVKGADAFCREHGIKEIFQIEGPEPAKVEDLEPVNVSNDTWQLVIRKERKE